MNIPSKILIANKQIASVFRPDEPTIIIRITDPNSQFISLKNKDCFVDILELRFYDHTPEIFNPQESDRFNLSIIDKVLHFLSNNNGRYSQILIHCDYGCSRSPGLGLALSKHCFNNQPAVIIIHSSHNINPLQLIDKIFQHHSKQL